MADKRTEVAVVIQAVRDEAKRWADLKPIMEQLHAAVDALDLTPSAFWLLGRELDSQIYALMYAGFQKYLLNILQGGAVEFGQLSQALHKIADAYARTDQIGKLNLNKIFDAGQVANPGPPSPRRSADSLSAASAAAPAPRPTAAPPVHSAPTPSSPPVQAAPTPPAPSMPAAPPPPAPPELPTVSSVQPLPTFTGMPVVSELPRFSELDSPPPPPPPPSTVAAPGATIPTVLDADLFGREKPVDGEEA
jgi:hypothetical protein